MVKNIDSIYKELGKRIADTRKKHGMSQEKLASESGLDRSHIGFIEQGHRKPTIATLHKLTKAMDISLENLFKGL